MGVRRRPSKTTKRDNNSSVSKSYRPRLWSPLYVVFRLFLSGRFLTRLFSPQMRYQRIRCVSRHTSFRFSFKGCDDMCFFFLQFSIRACFPIWPARIPRRFSPHNRFRDLSFPLFFKIRTSVQTFRFKEAPPRRSCNAHVRQQQRSLVQIRRSSVSLWGYSCFFLFCSRPVAIYYLVRFD